MEPNNLICPHCRKQFTGISSLHRHINQTHLHITKIIAKTICPRCNEKISRNNFINHLILKHGFSYNDAFSIRILANKPVQFQHIPDSVILKYIQALIRNNIDLKTGKIYETQFASFYKIVTSYMEFSDSRYEQFFNKILPWRHEHPRISNSRNLIELIFADMPDLIDKAYNELMRNKNPWFDKHDSSRSPFSRTYKGYIGLSEDEITEKIKSITKYDMPGRNPNQKQYWIKRGCSEYDAEIKAKEHQPIFSLENCIKKYGDEEGRRRFKERQEKWQMTLLNKPIEELARINHDKVSHIGKNGPKSKIEHEFLMAILNDESKHNVFLKDQHTVVDLLYNNKIIEFYGDYWHCNPNDKRFSDGTYYNFFLKMTAAEKWEFDSSRLNRLTAAGYDVKIVWETDYKNNKDAVIENCKKFLEEK